jgi:hypothetical protein
MKSEHDLSSGLPLLGAYAALVLFVMAAGIGSILIAGQAIPGYVASLMMLSVLIGGLIVPWPIAVWLTRAKPIPV